jgi:NADH:ubiquinone oxidoreductase subunit F (NADH-binding)/NADH:ubiquinone oxidoreductase subunit E
MSVGRAEERTPDKCARAGRVASSSLPLPTPRRGCHVKCGYADVLVRGGTVIELERRYGLAGTSVLERLREVKSESGRIAPEDVARIADELGLPRAHVHGAASFYADLGFEPSGDRHVRVCAGTACFAATGGAHIDELEQRLGVRRGKASADGQVSLQPVYCLGYCYASPAALDGETPCAGPNLVEQLAGAAPASDPAIPLEAAVDEPVVLAGIAGTGPPAWSAWRHVLATGDRARIIEEVLASGLRGRGGAGFPAARKWETAAQSPSDGPRYLVCNGDEGDPGSYVDRLLMERDPHRVLEGMALAAFASDASRGYVYVRSEYPRARDRLREAVAEARSAGELGTDVHGSGVDFDVEVFEGAGSYVAGEETSLIRSMEGLRGGATKRPPFPAESGLLGRPTVVNNVETLTAVPWVMSRGGDAYARLGIGDSKGTKLVCLNERFARPGAYEVELGVTLRYICEHLGGGLRDGCELRSLQVGGPLGGFLGPDELDTPLTFNALEAAGAALGHGSLVAFDQRTSAAALLRHVWQFAADESCGTCFPCRIGSMRGLEIAEAADAGMDAAAVQIQEELLETMGRASLCGFGQSVPISVRSLMRVYGNELGTNRQ